MVKYSTAYRGQYIGDMIYWVSKICALFKEISYPEDSRPCSNQMLVGTDKRFGTLITNHISNRHTGSCIQKKSCEMWAIMETDFEDWIQLGCMNDVFFIQRNMVKDHQWRNC